VTRTAPHPWSGRTGIYHRPSGREPWKLLLHIGKPELARRVMIDMAATGGPKGDYCTGPTDRPPARFR
jgi:hypothetical protein